MDNGGPSYGVKSVVIDGAVNPNLYFTAFRATLGRPSPRQIAGLIFFALMIGLLGVMRWDMISHHEDTFSFADGCIITIFILMWFYPGLRNHNDRKAVRMHVSAALFNRGLISDDEYTLMRREGVVARESTNKVVAVDQDVIRDGVTISCIVRLLYGGSLQYNEIDVVAQKRDIAQYGPPAGSPGA